MCSRLRSVCLWKPAEDCAGIKDTMDIYADLPSAKPASDATASSSAKASTPASASKGSWAHSKFQGMIANRRTVKAVSVSVCVTKDGWWELVQRKQSLVCVNHLQQILRGTPLLLYTAVAAESSSRWPHSFSLAAAISTHHSSQYRRARSVEQPVMIGNHDWFCSVRKPRCDIYIHM